MQGKNQSARDFSERTDALSTALNISLRDLAARIGISQAMLFAYRTGKNPISKKAWKKLLAAEIAAGLVKDPELEKREMRAAIASLPVSSRSLPTTGHLAWGHYLALEALFDQAQLTRAPLPPHEETAYQELLRSFATNRERGRAAVLRCREIADGLAALLLAEAQAEKGGGKTLLEPIKLPSQEMALSTETGRPLQAPSRRAQSA